MQTCTLLLKFYIIFIYLFIFKDRAEKIGTKIFSKIYQIKTATVELFLFLEAMFMYIQTFAGYKDVIFVGNWSDALLYNTIYYIVNCSWGPNLGKSNTRNP